MDRDKVLKVRRLRWNRWVHSVIIRPQHQLQLRHLYEVYRCFLDSFQIFSSSSVSIVINKSHSKTAKLGNAELFHEQQYRTSPDSDAGLAFLNVPISRHQHQGIPASDITVRYRNKGTQSGNGIPVPGWDFGWRNADAGGIPWCRQHQPWCDARQWKTGTSTCRYLATANINLPLLAKSDNFCSLSVFPSSQMDYNESVEEVTNATSRRDDYSPYMYMVFLRTCVVSPPYYSHCPLNADSNILYRSQSTYVCRVQSSVWYLPKYWPPNPLFTQRVCPPPHQRPGVQSDSPGGGGGGQYFGRRKTLNWPLTVLISLQYSSSLAFLLNGFTHMTSGLYSTYVCYC